MVAVVGVLLLLAPEAAALFLLAPGAALLTLLVAPVPAAEGLDGSPVCVDWVLADVGLVVDTGLLADTGLPADVGLGAVSSGLAGILLLIPV